MRAAGPWFLESSYRNLPDAEARYAAFLLLAQTERGSVELVEVQDLAQGVRTDMRTLHAWSYRPDQSAFDLRAWPMDAASHRVIDGEAADLLKQAASRELPFEYRYAPPSEPKDRTLSAVSALPDRVFRGPLAIGAAALLLCACAFQLGRSYATPDVTAAMVGVVTPRFCYELGEDAKVARIWTEHPEMKLDEIKDVRRIRGIEGLQGSSLRKYYAERELKRLNYLRDIE
ncbi:hypothetical protein MBRA_06306 [Methylobacterium brachiatum]|nr:hypothetical protein MBRA_06306 [Methylobacterium brachiatum]